MKSIFTLLLIVAFNLASAQDTTWTKTDTEWYGTRKEKQEQSAIANKVGYELYRLIGFKEYYANGIATYMQEHGYNLDNTQEVKGGATLFTFSQKIGSGRPPKVYLKYWTGRDKRITKAQITGHAQGIAKLFIYYWPTDPQWPSTDQIKRGVIATKMLIDEKITLNYTSTQPIITITKI